MICAPFRLIDTLLTQFLWWLTLQQINAVGSKRTYQDVDYVSMTNCMSQGLTAATLQDEGLETDVHDTDLHLCGTWHMRAEGSGFRIGEGDEEDRATYKYVWSRSSAKRAGQGLEEIRRLSKDELFLLLKIC